MAGGGIVSANAGPTSIVNSTIDANSVGSATVPTRGGGLVFGYYSKASLTNVTVSSNSASSASSIYIEGGSVHLHSTILSSASKDGCLATFGGTIASAGDNLDAGSNCALNLPSDRNGIDPMLGPLQNNGGPTPTRALLPGSPAIDAVPLADCPPPTTDQRGVTRPQGPACDIGAFEVQQDNTPAVLHLPSQISVNATSARGATVRYLFSATDPDDAVTSSSCTPASGSTFAIGTTTVNCTATDSHGNTAMGSFAVRVKGADEQLTDSIAKVQDVESNENLDQMLQEAQAYLRSGDNAHACSTLSKFVKTVRGLGHRIPPAMAKHLIIDANRILVVIGC